jgi:hypothetical protein
MYPHERSLVKKLENKPFALLGIDLDKSKKTIKKYMEAEKNTWRYWYDGPQGPIAKKWNVYSTPKIYVLDHKGVIRYKDVGDKAMDKAVDTLLKEMAKKVKK